ncbi:hypothetical protein ACQ86B_16310 [Mycolicibacterium aichiense]|uniref:hypothetical protein n=1 Tax=Mycolicibacterium aichiense TaxID=1799 RepID=UPI003D673624
MYDAETASGVGATGQTYPSLNAMDDLQLNTDGSVTLHIGPTPLKEPRTGSRQSPGRAGSA